MSVKKTEKKCPECGRTLFKMSTTEIVDGKEEKVYVGYFCKNCDLIFKLKEINDGI